MRDKKVRIGDKVECIQSIPVCMSDGIVIQHNQCSKYDVTEDNINALSNPKYFKLIETLAKGDKVRRIATDHTLFFSIGQVYTVDDAGCGYVQFNFGKESKVTCEVCDHFWKSFEKIYSGGINFNKVIVDPIDWVIAEYDKMPAFSSKQEKRIKELVRLVNNEQNKPSKKGF